MSSFALDQVIKSISAEDADEHFGTIESELSRIEADLKCQLAMLIRAQNTLANRKQQRLNNLQATSSQIAAGVVAYMSRINETKSLKKDMDRIRRRHNPMTYIIGQYRYIDATIAVSNKLPPIDKSIIVLGAGRNVDECSNFYRQLIKRINDIAGKKSATVRLISYSNDKIHIVFRVTNSAEYRNKLESFKRSFRQKIPIKKRMQTIDDSIEALFAQARANN